MSSRRFAVLTATLLCFAPSLLEAQVINRPQRAFRGLFGGNRPSDPNVSRQELSLLFNALGGYDDNAAAGEGIGSPTTALTPTGGGNTGTFDATLAYFRGREARSIAIDVGAGLVTYRNVPLDPSRSVSLHVVGRTTLGSRTILAVAESLSYSSQYRLDAPLTDDLPFEDTPTTDSSIFGLGGRSSVNNATSASLQQRISRAGRLSGTYAYTTTTFTEGDTGGYRSQRAEGRYINQVGRWWQTSAGYEYSTTRYGFGPNDDGRPLREDRVTGGVAWERRVSPRRTLSVSTNVGGLRIEALTAAEGIPYTIWTPSAEFSARLDLNRDWNLGGNYRRGADTLEGLTTEAFINDTGTITLSGLASRRLELAFLGGFARGTTAAEGGLNSRYLTTTGSTQVRIALTRMLSTVVSYHYYRYNFRDTVLPEGIAPEFNRNAVRVGLSLWLPLYGSSAR